MFDTNGNGYFDRWEYVFGDGPPITVADERAEDVPWDFEALCKRYVERILPEAVEAISIFMGAMSAPPITSIRRQACRAAGGQIGNFAVFAGVVANCRTGVLGIGRGRRGALAGQPGSFARLNARACVAVYVTDEWELRCLLSNIDALYGQGKLERRRAISRV
jgi:hypothetical protein